MSPSAHWPVQTERLHLRPVEARDRDAVLAWRSIPDVVKFMYQEPWTDELADARIAEWAVAPFAAPGDRLVLVAALDGQPIGELHLKWHEVGQVELGWTFSPRAQGHGYATEAARACLGLAFQRFRFHRVVARIDEENGASIRVAEKLGMRREARLIESGLRPADGVWGTEVDYAMLEREWTG